MAQNLHQASKIKQRTPALWMIIFIYFCFAVYGVRELFEAVALSLLDRGFMVTSFFFSIVFWTQPLLFALLGIAAVGLFKIQEWARILSIVLAWAIVILRIILWIDLMMRGFVALPVEDVFTEAVNLTAVSAFFLFVYYYFNIPRIKKMFLRQAKQEKLNEALLKSNRRGFALLGLLLAAIVILILFFFYFRGPRSCPFTKDSATLSEYGINTSNYQAIEDSARDKVADIQADRLKKMEQLEQQLR
jgi:hypothetical protein